MRSRRILHAGVLGAAVCTLAAVAIPAAPALASKSPAPSAMSSQTHSYVVFLTSSTARVSTGAERAAVLGAQSGVASRLATMGVRVQSRSIVPDTLTVRLTPSQVATLRADRAVAHVFANGFVPAPKVPSITLQHGATSHPAKALPASLCGTAANPQLNPEALTNINAEPAINAGFNGKGVSVAYMADGVDTTIADFQRNHAFASAGSPTGSPAVNEVDFAGDGSGATTGGGEAFLDASSIVAQANTTYDLSNFVNAAHPLPPGCDIKVQGSAPGASLTALKIFASHVATTTSNFIQAISYAASHGVKVLNESFGGNPFPDSSTLNTIKLANDAAVAAGVTVVVSSGDAGISSTIGSPADDPNVIAVGATTTFRGYAQDTYGGINAPGVGNGTYLDNNISSLSSGGFAQDGKTVDLVAPGDLNWALCSASALFTECGGKTLELSGGTSESAPLTSGAAADVIQAYAATHHGALPTPALVKHILTSTATNTGAPADQQGAGLLDVTGAVALARSIAGTTLAHRPGGLLANTSQLDLSGLPHQRLTGSVRLTNTGTSPVKVYPHARELARTGQVTGSVTLDPSNGTSQPKFAIWSGAQEIYQTSTFVVPANTDRLKLNAGYTYTGQASLLHVALFSPNGTYAGYSLPQGLGDYADVEVAAPAAGTWTAVFFTVWDGAGFGNGTSGLIPYTASFWGLHSVGYSSLSTLVIPPGGSAVEKLYVNTSTVPGDQALFLHIAGSMTIPIVLRTRVPVNTVAGGMFHGVLTGGNGRAGAPAQTNTYTFNVPSGKRDLDVSLQMASNPPGGGLPGDQFIGMLVDPTGQVVAYDTNFTDNSGGPVVNPYIQLYKAKPAAGNWQFVVDWANPVTGVADAVPFTAAVRFNLVSASSNLPNSASSTISATSGGTFGVTVHNTGVAPMILTPDARTTSYSTFALSDTFGGAASQSLPGANNTWYIPTETQSFTTAEAATVPATFDVSTYPGDPDISPQTGGPYVTSTQTATLAQITYAPPTGVGSGLWFQADSEIGPYGPSGQPSATEVTSASVSALGFDTTVSSTNGDVVQALTTGGASIAPETVDPGSTYTIPITIAPTAAPSTVVSGTLFVVGLTPGGPFGISTLVSTTLFTSELAAIPYTYTVAP